MTDQPGIALMPDESLDHINERLCLIRKKNGLTFGTDAYLLSAFVRPMAGARAVDLGSGTGILPLLLLKKARRCFWYQKKSAEFLLRRFWFLFQGFS